jgi:hypothetical protein
MGKYSAQWNECRRIQTWLLSWFLGGLVAPFLLFIIPIQHVSQTFRQVAILGYLGLWGIGTIYWRIRISRFRCPRCSQYFFGNSRIPLSTCPHCGLRRNEDA